MLDPEREYINVAREMDGEVVQISGDSHTYINPFDLELVEGEQPLAMKVDAIMSMVEMMAKNLSPMQKTLVDRSRLAHLRPLLRHPRPARHPPR